MHQPAIDQHGGRGMNPKALTLFFAHVQRDVDWDVHVLGHALYQASGAVALAASRTQDNDIHTRSSMLTGRQQACHTPEIK